MRRSACAEQPVGRYVPAFATCAKKPCCASGLDTCGTARQGRSKRGAGSWIMMPLRRIGVMIYLFVRACLFSKAGIRFSLTRTFGSGSYSRASDPKVDAGFGKNPMRKQKAGAAAPSPSVRPPL